MPITPNQNETQSDFAIRFHEAMAETIPVTDARDREMMATWCGVHGAGQLHAKAAERFGRDHEYHSDRPVFAEHMTKDKDGGALVYDRAALAAIVDRNNSRIADTADFSPITEGHTPGKDAMAEGAGMPRVLGYAGPYRLGMIGNENARYAIFADEWHAKEDVEKLRKLRRRSPEVWLEERVEDQFFDPIAALGAETPRLDTGMTWYARRNGKRVAKYSAAAFPASETAFVPGEKYAADQPNPETGEPPMLTPEDVQNVVDAVMATQPMQWVVAQMDDAPAHVEGGDPATTGDEYGGDMEEPDKMMGRYMAGDCDDKEIAEYRASYRNRRKKKHIGHGKHGYAAGDDKNDKATVVEDKDAKRDRVEGVPVTYTKTPAQREAEREDKARYAKMQSDLAETQNRLNVIETEKTKAERYARLQTSRFHYAFDLDKEVARCAPDKMSGEQFDDHLDVIVENYQRIPTADQMPILYTPDSAVPAVLGGSGGDEDKEKTALEASKYCLVERAKGNNVEWKEALEHVQAKKTG